MSYVTNHAGDIDRMPRGGFDASCLDRLLETDRVRTPRPGTLDWTGWFLGDDQKFAAVALDLLAETPDPRILELGAGDGALSRQLLTDHPTSRVTVTDVDAHAVAELAASDLGSHPRAVVRQVDATDIDAADGSYDLAVFARSLHHLSPAHAARVMAEGARVATALLIIDLPRPPAPLHLVQVAATLPFIGDGLLSSLRCYSPSALRSLARHAGVDVELRGGLTTPQIAIVRRRRVPATVRRR